MRTENPSKDKPLSQTLRSWKTEAPLPPRFAEAVWKKIDRADSVHTVNLWTVLQVRIAAAFARPSLAVCYVASLLVVGLVAGYWQGRVGSQRAEERLSAQYVQSVDPYQRSDR